MMPTLVSESASMKRELWTATDFLDWLQPGVHADLIDGEEFMHSPVSLKNARLTNFLDHLLRSWLERTTFGGDFIATGITPIDQPSVRPPRRRRSS
jgi:hypothetical protein